MLYLKTFFLSLYCAFLHPDHILLTRLEDKNYHSHVINTSLWGILMIMSQRIALTIETKGSDIQLGTIIVFSNWTQTPPAFIGKEQLC